MRLIDADALLYNLEGTMAVSPTGYIHGDTIVDMIGDAPTIELERTGRWIDHAEEGYVECPFCHSATNCDDNISELHFCFSCGARMDVE